MNLTKSQLATGTYKLIGGIWHKRCRGPAHDKPEWLPITTKYFYFRKSGEQKGRPFPQCRLCSNWLKLKSPGSHHGYVPVRDARPFYQEAVNRVGIAELSRRSGVTMSHIRNVITDIDKQFVEKATLRKIMLELVSMQRKSEYIDDPRVKWHTERRNNRGHETCKTCKTPVSNWTRGCKECYSRFYDKRKRREIKEAEWQYIRHAIWASDRNPDVKVKRKRKKKK